MTKSLKMLKHKFRIKLVTSYILFQDRHTNRRVQEEERSFRIQCYANLAATSSSSG